MKKIVCDCGSFETRIAYVHSKNVFQYPSTQNHKELFCATDALARHFERHPEYGKASIFVASPSFLLQNVRRLTALNVLAMNKVEQVAIVEKPLLCAMKQNVKTALVVEFGYRQICVTPVVDMHIVRDARTFVPVGGECMDECMWKWIAERGYELSDTPGHREFVAEIKENKCYLAPEEEFDALLAEWKIPSLKDKTYDFGEGAVCLGSELIRVPEIVFRPALAGIDSPGVIEETRNCIAKIGGKCPGAIILAGKLTQLGFEKRFQKAFPDAKIVSDADPTFQAADRLASAPGFPGWIKPSDLNGAKDPESVLDKVDRKVEEFIKKQLH